MCVLVSVMLMHDAVLSTAAFYANIMAQCCVSVAPRSGVFMLQVPQPDYGILQGCHGVPADV